MGIDSFEEKFRSKVPQEDIDIDKVPPPESYPESITSKVPEKDTNFDINPEEGLINEEENKRQEDDTEEIVRNQWHVEKPRKKEKISAAEKLNDDLKINEKLIELRSDINKIEKQMRLTEKDSKQYVMLEEHLKVAQSEFNELLNKG